MSTNKLILTGANGQLGKTIRDLWATHEISAKFELINFDRNDLDITNHNEVDEKLSIAGASIIVNAAGYTQVDRAMQDSQEAFAVNKVGVTNLANWAAANSARLIHVSTDFVFDGSKNEPYSPEDQPSPLGIYGESKLAGEEQLQELLPDRHLIVRTSWLYSEHGNNFVKTMLRLMQERDKINVVNDQIGSPTSTHSLAEMIFAIVINEKHFGLYHWSDGGEMSWFEFAMAIQQEALTQAVLDKKIPIQPITTAEYKTPAKRPAYSVLNRSKILADFDCPTENWKQQLRVVIDAIANAENIEE